MAGAMFVDFYHYTSEDAARLIINSKMIRESSSGGPDAMLGTGVYGTAVSPSAGKQAIAYNNWTGGWQQREVRGQVDFVFKIQMPAYCLQEFQVPNRHIYLHKGPIILNNYQWQCFALP